MNRKTGRPRNNAVLALLASLAVPLSVVTASGEEAFQPKVEATELSPDLTLLQARHRPGGHVNSLLLRTSKGALLVDHAGDWRTLQASPDVIAAIGAAIDGVPIRYLVNTHWHGDHTAGNTVYPEAEIIAHENVKARLIERQTPHWYADGIGPMDRDGWPRRTFTDSLELEFENERVVLWHFGPAHSDGDAVVYFERADVVHMGDLFHGLHHASVGDDMRGLVRTFAATLERITPETRIVTGHGGVSSTADLRSYMEMLSDGIAHVQALIDEEKPMEEILETELPTTWSGTLPDREIAMWYREIYRTLTGR